MTNKSKSILFSMLAIILSGCISFSTSDYSKTHEFTTSAAIKTSFANDQFKIQCAPDDLYFSVMGQLAFLCLIEISGNSNGIISNTLIFHDRESRRFVIGEYHEMKVGNQTHKILAEHGKAKVQKVESPIQIGGSILTIQQDSIYTVVFPSDSDLRISANSNKDITCVLIGKEECIGDRPSKPCNDYLVIPASVAKSLVSEIDSAIYKSKRN